MSEWHCFEFFGSKFERVFPRAATPVILTPEKEGGVGGGGHHFLSVFLPISLTSHWLHNYWTFLQLRFFLRLLQLFSRHFSLSPMYAIWIFGCGPNHSETFHLPTHHFQYLAKNWLFLRQISPPPHHLHNWPSMLLIPLAINWPEDSKHKQLLLFHFRLQMSTAKVYEAYQIEHLFGKSI